MNFIIILLEYLKLNLLILVRLMDKSKDSRNINIPSNLLLDINNQNNQNSILIILSNHINTLKEYYEKYIKDQEKSLKDKINSIFSEITSIINLLSKEKNRLFYQYESSLQKSENKIRALYSDIFNLNVKKTYLENNMDILLKKEQEYKLVKEKTGVVVENGTIVYNDRKENEIFILRTENSTLKNVITEKEKELDKLKEKYENEKENNEKIMNKINNKFNIIKSKMKTRNPSIKGKSNSTININSNIIKRPNLKLNYTINNSTINKVKKNCITLTSRLNNNNSKGKSGNNINDLNKKNLQKQFDFSIFKKNEKKYKRNYNFEGTKISLVSCHSTGILGLKSNIINKLNKTKQSEAANQKIIYRGLNLSKANDLTNKNKKDLYLTPKSNNTNIQEAIIQTYRKIDDIKKSEKINIINKNQNMTKKYNTNQSLNENYNYKDIRILFKNNMKNKSSRQNKIISKEQIKKETTLNQNHMVHNSPFEIKKVFVKSKNSKNKKNIYKINKLSKNMNETNYLKNYKYIIINNKIQINENNISKKENEKNSSKYNKCSLTSIRRKNINNSLLNEYKTDLIDYSKFQ